MFVRSLVIKTCHDHPRLQQDRVPSQFVPPSNVGPDARLVVGEEGPQPGDRTAYERESSPSAESILATSQGLFAGQHGRIHQELNQLNPS